MLQAPHISPPLHYVWYLDNFFNVKVFNEIDADGNGYITPEEVVVGFTKLGVPVTLDEAKAIVKSSDTDGDGRVSYPGMQLITELVYSWVPSH